MTELARTPPALRRLFRLVDLGPKPHDDVTRIGLDFWRKQRGGRSEPSLQSLLNEGADPFWSHVLVVEPIAGRRDYALVMVGASVAGRLGFDLSEQQLSQIGNPRVAVRLRRLFELATERGDAVLVQFVDRVGPSSEAQIEALAAPIVVEGRRALMCILSSVPLHPRVRR